MLHNAPISILYLCCLMCTPYTGDDCFCSRRLNCDRWKKLRSAKMYISINHLESVLLSKGYGSLRVLLLL